MAGKPLQGQSEEPNTEGCDAQEAGRTACLLNAGNKPNSQKGRVMMTRPAVGCLPGGEGKLRQQQRPMADGESPCYKR